MVPIAPCSSDQNPHLHKSHVACNTRTWRIALALGVIVLVEAVALAVVLASLLSLPFMEWRRANM